MSNEELTEKLEAIALDKTHPFCYACYKRAETGKCATCGSDDLMRELEGNGVEYGTGWIIEALLIEALPPINVDESFEEMMNDSYSEPVDVCGYKMDQVQLLKDCDPVAWRCAQSDWESAQESDEIWFSPDNGNTYYERYAVERYIEENEPEEKESEAV